MVGRPSKMGVSANALDRYRECNMSSRLFILVSAFLLVPLLNAPAWAECGPFPSVSWWGKLSHEGVKAYVAQKHGGDWSGYLDKWSRQLDNVRAIYGEGKGIKIPSTGTILKGPQLSEYIDKIAQRVDVNECLSKEPASTAAASTEKKTQEVPKVTPFGEGVDAYRAGDFKIAHDIWLPLAEAGDAKAQNALGHLYRKGLGVDSDLDISRQWYGKSAAKGNRGALFSLGDIARTTATNKEEMDKAIILIRESANLNYGGAQFTLAEIIHRGEDIKADDGEAYFWVSLALMNKNKNAQALKDILDKSLSADVKTAQSVRAQEWLAKLKK